MRSSAGLPNGRNYAPRFAAATAKNSLGNATCHPSRTNFPFPAPSGNGGSLFLLHRPGNKPAPCPFVRPVPRYFFHLYNGGQTLDDEGLVLPDMNSAWDTAIRSIRDLMKEDLINGHISLSHRIEITDEYGRILRTVSFKEAVTVEG